MLQNFRGGHEMEMLKFRTDTYKASGGGGKFVDTKTGNWRTQRPIINVEKCCRCGWCYLYCPTGCVEEKDAYFAVNLDYCKGCAICARECSVNAIEMVAEGG